VDYPRVAVKVMRYSFLFNPWFHEGSIAMAAGGYEELAEGHRRIGKVCRQIDYQTENQV